MPRAVAAPFDVSVEHDHPRAVRQRLDLVGDAKVCVPMIVDLTRRRPVDAAPEELERLTAGDLVAALAPRG